MRCDAVCCNFSPFDSDARAKQTDELASPKKTIAELTGINAELDSDLKNAQRELDDLRHKAEAFSLRSEGDWNNTYSFNDGISILAREIIGSVTKNLNDATPKTGNCRSDYTTWSPPLVELRSADRI